MKRTLALTAAAALLLPVATDEPERNVCYRTDSGWTLVSYDDAASLGGSLTSAVLPYNGSCAALDGARLVIDHGQPTPTPQVRTVVREVVRVKVVTRRCVVVRRPGAIDKRRCAVTVRWSS